MVALLALRVSVGWHFYKEGVKKLQNPDGFTSAPFLRSATGHWAESFHDMARQPHDWDRLLAVPLERIELDEEQQKEIAEWESENKEALATDVPPISPHTTYAEYVEKVSEDWKADLEGMLSRSKQIKIDREAILEETEESIQAFSDGLKVGIEKLSKQADRNTGDIEELKSISSMILTELAKKMDKDLAGIIDQLKLDEKAAKKEKETFQKSTEEMVSSWKKQAAKLIDSSYTEIAATSSEEASEESKSEEPKAEAAESEPAESEEPSAEQAKPKTGEPPEPEDSEPAAAESAAESKTDESETAKPAKAEASEAEATETEATQPEVIKIKVTPPEATAYEELAKSWKEDASDLIDETDPVKVAGKKYQEYRRYLIGYFEGIDEDLRKYQHELWRLDQLKTTAADVPYQKERIADKKSETFGMVAPWLGSVQAMETSFHDEVGTILGSADEPITVAPRKDKLSTIDKIVPYWHLIVGAGLVLGLFSRLCGAGAAVFLAAVIATQPPWVADAADTYYQVVELCGCLVLATIPTGRFAGLDFFVHSLFSRCCTRT